MVSSGGGRVEAWRGTAEVLAPRLVVAALRARFDVSLSSAHRRYVAQRHSFDGASCVWL